MDDTLLTPKEAAKRLGVSPQTVRALIHQGKLAAFQVGKRRYRIPKQAIVDYLNNNESSLEAIVYRAAQKAIQEVVQTEILPLLNRVTPEVSTHSVPKPMSVAEVAALFNVSKATVLSWIKSGVLEAQKINERYYIPQSSLQALLNRPVRPDQKEASQHATA